MKKHPILVAGLMLASGFFSRQVLAESAAEAPASTSSGLTREQMQAFADLTGGSPYLVSRRLAAEPNLIPLAAKAADARRSRKTTGLIMTVVGFTIVGVGDIVGAGIIATTPGYPKMDGHEDRLLLGAGIVLGSLAVGLALGIPGIVKMAAPSSEEQKALDAYSRTRSLSAARPALSSGCTLMAPLFGLTF